MDKSLLASGIQACPPRRAELPAELLRIADEAFRKVPSLLGPYDYSREWRSVLQLLLKMLTFAVVAGLAFPLVFVAGSFLFKLVLGF